MAFFFPRLCAPSVAFSPAVKVGFLSMEEFVFMTFNESREREETN